MSGIGHLTAGFAAKSTTPVVPLWALLAAGEANDLLYFVFSSIGLESKSAFSMDFVHGVRYVQEFTHPWSHGLFMSIVWSSVATLLAYLIYRNHRTAGIIGLVVFSHWILDFLMHSNLPISFGSAPLLGLGLENSGAGFLFMTVFDIALLGIGIMLYFRSHSSKSTTTK
ncbi:MAG: hypothetical protein QM730_21705 [Anaerolineales bacterium]